MTELESILKENQKLQSLLQKKDIELNHYKDEVSRLNDIVKKFKDHIYGKKSERVEDLDVDQLTFNELENCLNIEVRKDTEQITYTRSKGRQKRKDFPEDLVREVVEVELLENERICPHHSVPLKEIGFEEREKLITKPAQMIVRVERVKKYVATCCESAPVLAKTNSILPGTIATPELLSFIVFSKFFQGLTLYRLEELFELFEVVLSRGTMARWLVQVSEKLMPIWNVLSDRVQSCGYQVIDETKVQVLKEKGRRPELKSSMWVRGSPEQGIMLFEYDPSSSGKVAERLLQDFEGAVQSDAHRGYNRLKNLRLGCFMHMRRKYFEAHAAAKKGSGLAEEALSFIREIYRLEALYKDQKLSNEDRRAARLRDQSKLLGDFKTWAENNKAKVPASSRIGIAINYQLDEWEHLTNYLKDGRFEIDNGEVERAIRKFAIGRNNWLFCDTVDGANASSLFYSLMVTAKLNEKDPYEAMVKILSELPLAKTIDDYEKLAGLLLR